MSTAATIRVVIAEDEAIVRAGVRLLLEAEPDIEVVGEAEDGRQAIEQTEELRPDVVLMDIAMPGTDGLEATREIKVRCPESGVLVLTVHRSEKFFYEALKAGALGYVLKGAEPSELIGAIRAVARGEVFLQPQLVKSLVQDYLERERQLERGGPSLTSRETEILTLLAEGFSVRDIGERLFISASTVYSHRTNLMTKLGFSKRHELIRYARRLGLLPPA
jgi:two-component system response regulator NreC